MKKRRVIFLILAVLALAFVLGSVFFNLGLFPWGRGLETILSELQAYEYGSHDDILLRLKSHVSERCGDISSRTDCERQFLVFLESEATPTAKMEVCRILRSMGSAASVPVLERLILSDETSDMARYALEIIPGEAVDEAWLRMLAGAPDVVLPGVISSIGHRRLERAVPGLASLLQSPDPGIAAAAVIALGRIAGPEAVNLLNRALEDPDVTGRIQVTGSLLRCAEEFHRRELNREAGSIYDRILAARVPDNLREAALRGKITVSSGNAQAIILGVLAGTEEVLYTAAITMVPQAFTEHSLAELCRLLPRLPGKNQAQLLAALAGYRRPEVLSLAVAALESQDPEVRRVALETLGTLGYASSVGLLAQQASGSRYRERLTARSSLWRMKGEQVDDAVLEELDLSRDPGVQRELMKAVGERRIVRGIAPLQALAQEADTQQNRVEAIRTLREISPPSDLPRLIDLLLGASGVMERREWISTVAEVAGKIEPPEKRGELVERKLSDVTVIMRRRDLYRALGRIGDNSTLPTLKEALLDLDDKIRDTVAHVLAQWPDPTPKNDLLEIAQTSQDEELRVLALRNYIRMIGIEEFTSPEEAVELLETAMRLAQRPEEKIYILSKLPQFACRAALEMAETLTLDEDVRGEAMLASQKIRDIL
jgi:HEAT repeat protein